MYCFLLASLILQSVKPAALCHWLSCQAISIVLATTLYAGSLVCRHITPNSLSWTSQVLQNTRLRPSRQPAEVFCRHGAMLNCFPPSPAAKVGLWQAAKHSHMRNPLHGVRQSHSLVCLENFAQADHALTHLHICFGVACRKEVFASFATPIRCPVEQLYTCKRSK